LIGFLGAVPVKATLEVVGSSGSGGASDSGSNMQYASEFSSSATNKPIIAPFKETFDKCAHAASNPSYDGSAVDASSSSGPCKFENLGIQPSAAHLATSPGSCHNIGKAIDVGKVDCGNGVKDPRVDKVFYNGLSKCFLNDKTDGGTGKFQNAIYAYADKKETLPNGATITIKDDHTTHVHFDWDCKYGDGNGSGAAVAQNP
jgi:hypothetical protein